MASRRASSDSVSLILDEMTRVLPRLNRVNLNPGEIRDLVDSMMFIADLVEPAAVEILI
jgi:hypothetical protein